MYQSPHIAVNLLLKVDCPQLLCSHSTMLPRPQQSVIGAPRLIEQEASLLIRCCMLSTTAAPERINSHSLCAVIRRFMNFLYALMVQATGAACPA